MIRKILLILILVVISSETIYADEGMWLPLLLNKKEVDMKQRGMNISAKDIYDINNSSLKDAVMLFGRGCTGEFVSKEGLLVTNHHCGYGNIVANSTVEKDYLTNGFWAMTKSEELPCEGLTITLLVYMKDVTTNVLNGITSNISESQRNEKIKENIRSICNEATKDNHYSAEVKPFYYGNQYFLYVNEVFTDIRLVGAPPSNIGKFGGDTDNWMWPRHTGDFSMFRVYANKENKPSSFSKDNIPYKPKKHLKINIKGVKEGDFTFVFGYPARTQQYLTSFAVEQIANLQDPARIKIRTERLDIYNDAMNESPAQRLRYATNVAGIANGWKKWIGEVKGIERLGAIDKKKDFEYKFTSWVRKDKEREKEYAGLINSFESLYNDIRPLEMSYLYYQEAVLASDLMKNARGVYNLIKKAKKQDVDMQKIEDDADILFGSFVAYFNDDYQRHKIVDKRIFINTMSIFYDDFAKDNFVSIRNKVEKDFKSDAKKYFEYVYDKSFLCEQKTTQKMLQKLLDKKFDKILSDPAMELFSQIIEKTIDIDASKLISLNMQIDSLYRVYLRGRMEMEKDKEFFPDANSTLRVTYGQVKDYKPRDGVRYLPYTTIEGIMEKENPQIYDYVVEKKLKELYKSKDYGRYANDKGELPVAFIASNHTTGGNSGSPVLDANGNLVGVNFDRNWEGTMSDIIYDADQCRNISLDIRYLLFLVDKFAGAKNLIQEMEIVE